MALHNSAIVLLLIFIMVSLCSSLNYDQCEKGDSIFRKSNIGLSVSGSDWKEIFKIYKHDQCISRCHVTPNCKSLLVNESTCILKNVNRMSVASQITTTKQMEYFEKHQCAQSTPRFIAKVSDAIDCKDIYNKGWKADGVFAISKTPGGKTYKSILCEMTLLGGGWTVIQRRIDGSLDFNQNWANYKKGFGELDGNFWYGLDSIHNLTRLPGNEALIPFETESGVKYYPMYDEFMVAGEDDDYRLTVGSKVDVLGTSLTDGEGLDHHNQMRFSTPGKDNDVSSSRHCANEYSTGWWFRGCWDVHINGVYGLTSRFGINWMEVTDRGNHIYEPISNVKILVRRK